MALDGLINNDGTLIEHVPMVAYIGEPNDTNRIVFYNPENNRFLSADALSAVYNYPEIREQDGDSAFRCVTLSHLNQILGSQDKGFILFKPKIEEPKGEEQSPFVYGYGVNSSDYARIRSDLNDQAPNGVLRSLVKISDEGMRSAYKDLKELIQSLVNLQSVMLDR
ncbi:hypothetical protein GOV12_05695 [Candidatus Pacearchaeota archaeon]|nr:hypothetical protein [Candidatus Pacearchaeota archaeon]